MEKYTLYKNGKEAFEGILSCMKMSKKHIQINMFIWRDDNIGCEIAKAVLNAANRGVVCDLSIDRVGALFEYAEESGRSLFHKKLSALEKIKVKALSTYHNHSELGPSHAGLYDLLLTHPNIHVSKDKIKNDHSKFYVFDDEILILGGINIEDKENGVDSRGFAYQDYMVKMEGKEIVQSFFSKREQKTNLMDDPQFYMNLKEPIRYFEIEEHFLKLIGNSKKELTIVMAYFAPNKRFREAILKAVESGVKVSIMISKSANFQDDSNKYSVRKLLKKSGGKIQVFFSPMMLHTKLILADNSASLGSCNITRQSFQHLDECNLYTQDETLYTELKKDVEKNLETAERITDWKTIKYRKMKHFIEMLLA